MEISVVEVFNYNHIATPTLKQTSNSPTTKQIKTVMVETRQTRTKTVNPTRISDKIAPAMTTCGKLPTKTRVPSTTPSGIGKK